MVALHAEGVGRNDPGADLAHYPGVALHAEGVGRNLICPTTPQIVQVALHAEGVGRNGKFAVSGLFGLVSPSMRRAWVEIHQFLHL